MRVEEKTGTASGGWGCTPRPPNLGYRLPGLGPCLRRDDGFARPLAAPADKPSIPSMTEYWPLVVSCPPGEPWLEWPQVSQSHGWGLVMQFGLAWFKSMPKLH